MRAKCAIYIINNIFPYLKDRIPFSIFLYAIIIMETAVMMY